MDSSPNNTDLTQAQANLLELLERSFSILNAAHVERQTDSVSYTFNAPGVGEMKSSASSELRAIHLAIMEITSVLTTTPSKASSIDLAVNRPATKSKSKTRQLTIGVTMPTGLKEHLSLRADSLGTNFADVARTLVVDGFEDFENKSFFTSTKSLFSILKEELRQWQQSETQQVMLRLEPEHAVRIRAAAKESKKSVSEFGVLCLGHGLAIKENLEALEEKIAKYKGPALRPLLPEIGLDSYATPLLSGILAGSVEAPKPLLRRLARFFAVPEEILIDLFGHSFRRKAIPAYKAEGGKPVVANKPTSWEDAVKSLRLSPNQTKALLDMDE